MQKQLPLEYEQKKISLKDLIGGDYAWTKEVILKFLNDASANEFVVLGGDVILFEDNKPSYTYDSWSSDDRQIGESFASYYERARKKAIEYIEKYPMKTGIVFAPVITSEATAGL